MYHDFGITSKQAAMAYFTVESQRLPAMTEENPRSKGRTSRDTWFSV